MPLARFPARAQYNRQEVKSTLREVMLHAEADTEAREEDPVPPPGEEETQPPPCPRCGAVMVLRRVKQAGPTQGEQFWGCPNFPGCRGTRDLAEAP